MSSRSCARTTKCRSSAPGRPADVLGAIRAGACGYVTKLADPSMLIPAVHTVANGGFALSSQLADILQGELARVPAVVALLAAIAAESVVLCTACPSVQCAWTLSRTAVGGFGHAQGEQKGPHAARRQQIIDAAAGLLAEQDFPDGDG